MATSGPARPASQVTLKTVFTVCFGVLAVTALVFFLLRTQVSVTLSLGAGMLAVAMNHAAEALTRRGLPRKVAVPAVVVTLLALSAGLSVMLIPPVASQAKALFAAAPMLWQKIQQTRLFLALDAHFFLPRGSLRGRSSATAYVGPLVAGSSLTLLALITGGPLKAVATGIYFIVYGQLEGSLFSPLIFRHTVHVNPLITTLAILFMAEFMGLPGAIIAVPAAATAQIVIREILSLRKERDDDLRREPA